MKTYRSIQSIYLKAEKLGLKSNNNCRAVYCWETKQSYSSAAEAARRTGTQRSGITLCCNGEPFNTAGGYHWCFLENKNTFTPTKNPQWHKIYCIELKCIFNNANEAAEKLKIDSSSIRHCCAKRFKTAGGYHWCFLEEKESFCMCPSIQGKHGKAICCIELRQYFCSAKEAQNQTHTNRSSISRVLKEGGLANKMHWRWATEEEIKQQKYIEQERVD